MTRSNQNISYERTEIRRRLQASARLNAMGRRLRKAEQIDWADSDALLTCIITQRIRAAEIAGGQPMFPRWLLDRHLDRLFRRARMAEAIASAMRGRFALDAA